MFEKILHFILGIPGAILALALIGLIVWGAMAVSTLFEDWWKIRKARSGKAKYDESIKMRERDLFKTVNSFIFWVISAIVWVIIVLIIQILY